MAQSFSLGTTFSLKNLRLRNGLVIWSNSLPSATFDPVGKVTPVADTDNWPVPSESNIAPPRSIVCPSRNNSPKRFVDEPKFLVPFTSGNISCAMADKSKSFWPANSTILPPLFTNTFCCTGFMPTSPSSKSLVVGAPELAVNFFSFHGDLVIIKEIFYS